MPQPRGNIPCTVSYTQDEITRLLHDWSDGDPEALNKLMPLVFDDIRDIARRHFRHESPDHSLQPTALVNEVYLRLVGRRTVQWKNREHFFGGLAGMMRRILVDHARRRLSAKRGSGAPKISLDEAILPAAVRPADLVALDDALETLGTLNARQLKVVELKFFIGLTQEEIAEVLGVARSTVIRDWANAAAFLKRELSRRDEPAEVG